MNHNWYAVLPAQVLLSKELTDKQKLLIALISNLSNERGYCFASNKYLGDCLDCSESTIKDHLKKLEDMKILGRIIKLKDNGDFDYRSLIINIDIPKPEKNTTSAEKSAYPSARKLAHNNIVINNKDIIPNKIYNEKDAFVTRVDELKDKLGNQYQLFIDYWTESDTKGKMRFQDQKFFDMNRRISFWIRNAKNFEPVTNSKITTKIKLK
jgi:DNA-binding Lrp family transcriptional regulator